MAKGPEMEDRELKEELAAFARSERERLDGPPSDEDLKALHEGRLSAKEAEKWRDYLAIHPEWAEAYREMFADDKESSGAQDPAEGDDIARQRAWQAFASRVDEEDAAEPSPVPAPFSQMPERPGDERTGWAGRIWWAVAALVLLGIGSIFLQPKEEIPKIYVGVHRGGALVDIPRSAERIELVVDLSDHELEGSYVIRLRANRIVHSEERTLRAGDQALSLVVPVEDFLEKMNYRLEAIPSGAPADPVLLGAFKSRFIE